MTDLDSILKRDESGNITQMTSSDQIQGPLGIWPFPILNALFTNTNKTVEITEINRDEDGRIQSIEEIEI